MKHHAYILTACILGSISFAEPEDDEKLPELVYRSNAVYSVLEAAEAGNKEVIAARIKEGCNVNQVDETGNTALHLAAKSGASSCISLLLQAGADATIPDAKGKTAAQLTKSKKVLKQLKKYMDSRKDEMEICEKVIAGDMEPLKKAMKKKDFNANMLDKENKLSLLMLVCAHGDAETVRALIKAGANANFVSPDSRAVLHKAVNRDNAEIITALLEGGADPMAAAGNKAVALHDAVWEAKTESIKALLPAYKEINFSPPGGFNGTPINLAIDRNHKHVVQMFIDAGIDLNDGKHGQLPLVHAAVAGKPEIIEMLLKAGASKTAKGNTDKTAKEAAAESVRHLL